MVTAAAFSADGELVVTVSDSVRAWNTTTGQAVRLRPAEGAGFGYESLPTFSPVGQWLVTGRPFGPVIVRDLARADANPLVLKVVIGNARPAFSSDGKTIATVGFDRIVRLWETQTGKELEAPKVRELSPRAAGLPPNCLAYRPDGRAVLLGWGSRWLPPQGKHARREARVHETLSGEPIGGPLEHPEPVNAAAFSRDGAMIVTVGGQTAPSLRPNNSAKLWRRDPSKSSWQFDK
jgi:WD40 repeat protein